MAKTAIIYARVSTARQAAEALPITSQIEHAKQKAAAMGATILHIFRDDGVSGRSATSRPAFQDAIAFCATHQVDYFICWSTSRFARNKMDASKYKLMLKIGGTRVVYSSADIDPDTDEGWVADSLFEVMDELYSRNISRDTRRSMMQNARDGYYNGGARPFGYDVVAVGRRKKLIPNDAESAIVRDIFNMYVSGSGFKEISLQLNHRGLSRRGKSWNKTIVSLLIHNPVYCGYIVFNRMDNATRIAKPESQWIKTKSHAAIVSEETWNMAQEIAQSRAPRPQQGSPHSQHVFTGTLRCGACGSAMQIETATGRSRQYSYYNCSSALKGAGCKNRRIPADAFDEWLVDELVSRLLTKSRILDIIQQVYELRGDWVRQRSERRAAVVREIRLVESKRSNIFDIMETHGKDTPNLSDLTTRLREHKAKLDALEIELEQIETAPAKEFTQIDFDEAADAFSGILKNASPVKMRLFFEQFVEAITLTDDTVRVDYHAGRLVNQRPFDVVHSKVSWLPEHGLLRTISFPIAPKFLRLVA